MGTIRKVQRKAGNAYEAIVRVKGLPRLSKTFHTNLEAKNWITGKENEILQGSHVIHTSIEKTMMKDVLESYIAAHKKEEHGNITYHGITKGKEYRVRALIGDFEKYSIKNVTREKITKFIDNLMNTDVPPPATKKKTHKNYKGDILKKYSPATVRRYYFDLKTAMEWWALENKFDLQDRFKVKNIPSNWAEPRERRLHGDEEKRLLDACIHMLKAPRQWQLIIQFAMETAMRASEILKMEYTDLHLDKSKRFVGIRAETTKTKIVRQVPLNDKALEIMCELENKSETKEGRVFNNIPHQQFSAGFKKIALRAKCEDLRFHDLRHEAISRMFERNLSLSTIEIMLISGHTQQSTILRYANLRPNILADKLNKNNVA